MRIMLYRALTETLVGNFSYWDQYLYYQAVGCGEERWVDTKVGLRAVLESDNGVVEGDHNPLVNSEEVSLRLGRAYFKEPMVALFETSIPIGVHWLACKMEYETTPPDTYLGETTSLGDIIKTAVGSPAEDPREWRVIQRLLGYALVAGGLGTDIKIQQLGPVATLESIANMEIAMLKDVDCDIGIGPLVWPLEVLEAGVPDKFRQY